MTRAADDVTQDGPSPAQQAVATALLFNDTIGEYMLAEELRDLVDKVLYSLSLLPVEQRMEAMGMRPATSTDVPAGRSMWTENP